MVQIRCSFIAQRLVALSGLIAVVTGGSLTAQGEPPKVKVSAASLISRARTKSLPQYPKDSLKRNSQGVVVATMLVGTDGRVRTLEIVQAPDASIRDAMRQTLLTWSFDNLPRAPNNQPAQVEAKLFYYFVIENQQGLVFLPNDLAAHRGIKMAAPKSVNVIDEASGRQLAGKRGVILIDVQHRDAFSRDHLPNAVNVPEDETWARTAEFPRSSQILVDCPSRVADRCETAAREFSKAGFATVSILKRH